MSPAAYSPSTVVMRLVSVRIISHRPVVDGGTELLGDRTRKTGARRHVQCLERAFAPVCELRGMQCVTVAHQLRNTRRLHLHTADGELLGIFGSQFFAVQVQRSRSPLRDEQRLMHRHGRAIQHPNARSLNSMP